MSPTVVEILSPEELRRTLNRMALEIIERVSDLSTMTLVGIYTRGVPLAQILAHQMQRLEGLSIPVGALDITLYRDDLDKIRTRTPARSKLPTDLNGRTVVLVDDVIYSGRTIRAALNAVYEYGRPEVVQLAVLVDRGHRQVPIHPDVVGKALPTSKTEAVKVLLHDVDGRDGVQLIPRAS